MSTDHDQRLLHKPIARRLFHEVAAGLPIIDFHNHLDTRALADNHQFDNIAQLWVSSDPYKHRAMRIAGVPEYEITGNCSDRIKFNHWAQTLPQTIGGPLHAWTSLELQRYFQIETPLDPHSADTIWTSCNKQLTRPSYSARGLLNRLGVTTVCTSDRLLDDLSAHEQLAQSDYSVAVFPSLRADDICAVDQAHHLDWVQQLASLTSRQITDAETFWAAIEQRLDVFDALKCRLSDHALDDFHYETVNPSTTQQLLNQHLQGQALSHNAQQALRSGMLLQLGIAYARRGWTLQLHIGAQRATSSRLRQLAGPAGGYASIGNTTDIPSLCRFLDQVEAHGQLPRTILYPLNPNDYAPLATLTGSYASDDIAGLVQLGPAWWFNDHDLGIREHLYQLSRYGILHSFIGMTTDSRSLLSMVRHEYFRRVLCAWISEQVEAGHLPNNFAALSQLVRALCYENAANYLNLS
ncbi:glucuronate isomerase [Coraliomargarita algicola]|uniref:Uronate isomerase n=1 Tax=Coraliomargarita algicola TaxID=3092156 RepID=A0ABZ0RJ80_9BACT|nr:glucuronate isomerase [Coraliomargarita sp. J2-16]WPJ94850.1 glucuronate isomerase [Coraliomargarita sp. J2-16]